MERSHRKIHRSAEEKARLQAIREHFQSERPSLDELVDSGDYRWVDKRAKWSVVNVSVGG